MHWLSLGLPCAQLSTSFTDSEPCRRRSTGLLPPHQEVTHQLRSSLTGMLSRGMTRLWSTRSAYSPSPHSPHLLVSTRKAWFAFPCSPVNPSCTEDLCTKQAILRRCCRQVYSSQHASNVAIARMQMAIKCADIAHLSVDKATHKRWALQLEEEFFRQVCVSVMAVQVCSTLFVTP